MSFSVFLDIGFTLLGGPSLSPPKFIRETLDLAEKDMPLLYELVFCVDHDSPEALCSSIGRRLHKTPDPGQQQAIRNFWKSQATDTFPLPDALFFMEELIRHNARIHMVSNLWPPFYQAFARQFKTCLPHLASETLSFRERVRKPDPAFYAIAFEKAGKSPFPKVSVGDSLDNDIIPFARKGHPAVWYRSRPMDKKVLKQKRDRLKPFKRVAEAAGLKEALDILLKTTRGECLHDD